MPGLQIQAIEKLWETELRKVMLMPQGQQALVRTAVAKMFQDTPNDQKKLCFVKGEVVGIPDGGPIIRPDHQVVVEMMAQPEVGTLYCFMFHIVVESSDHFAWPAGNFLVLFKAKDSETAGETTAVQIRKHPSQEKFFEFLGKRKLRPPFVCSSPAMQ